LQKIDIVSFKENEPSTFKKLALLEAEKLWISFIRENY
jgi:hypothetical protein